MDTNKKDDLQTTKITHTPGPWKLGGSHNENIYAVLTPHTRKQNGAIKHIAQIQADVEGLKYGYTVEQCANARLIGAAPELLAEAVQLLANARYQDGHAIILTQDCEALEAAIRKAQGGQ